MLTALPKADGQPLQLDLLSLEHVEALRERLCKTLLEALDPSARCRNCPRGFRRCYPAVGLVQCSVGPPGFCPAVATEHPRFRQAVWKLGSA